MFPRVKDYMDDSTHSLEPSTDIRDAVRYLLEQHITGAPVLDENGEIVGMLTEKDCLKLLAGGDDSEYPSGTVHDYMSRDVTVVRPDMNIYFVAGMFMRDVVRRFPVVEDGKLVGAITRYDILRAIETNLPRRGPSAE